MAKLRHYVNTETLVNVYHAIVNSYIRYGIVVWGGANKSALKPLQTVVNKAVRIITFAPYGNLDLNPAYKQLKLLSVDQTHKLELAKLMFTNQNITFFLLLLVTSLNFLRNTFLMTILLETGIGQ